MSKAATVKQYLEELPDDRRREVFAVRSVLRKNLSKGFEETMNWGMITYEVPLKRYPNTYNEQPLCLAALAAQKRYLALYLMSAYGDEKTEKALREECARMGKKLDMGKSCIRFQKAMDLPLDLIGKLIRAQSVDGLIARYEKGRGRTHTKGKKR